MDSYAPPGVIFAVYIMLEKLTEKGDKVLMLMPNYDPLFEMIPKSGRVLVESQLGHKSGRKGQHRF